MTTALLLAPAMASLRAFTRFMSMPTGPGIATPHSAPRRASWVAQALATSALVGVHPADVGNGNVAPNPQRGAAGTPPGPPG